MENNENNKDREGPLNVWGKGSSVEKPVVPEHGTWGAGCSPECGGLYLGVQEAEKEEGSLQRIHVFLRVGNIRGQHAWG